MMRKPLIFLLAVIISIVGIKESAWTQELSSNFQVTEPGFGNAINFDGTNDFLKLPAELSSGIDNFTFETWIKWDGNDPEETILSFSFLNTDYALLTPNRFEMSAFYSNATVDGYFPNIRNYVSYELPTDTWCHLAVALDDENDELTIYINGQVVATNSTAGHYSYNIYDSSPAVSEEVVNGPFLLSSGQMENLIEKYYIGKGFSSYMGATLDELRFWNVTRTTEQIQDYARIPLSDSEDNLVYYYDFNEGLADGNNEDLTDFQDKVSNYEARILNFALEGTSSNLVNSDFALGEVSVIGLSVSSGISGEKVKIYGEGFDSTIEHNWVFFGENLAEVISAGDGYLEVLVPEVNEDSHGTVDVIAVNQRGYSYGQDFTLLYKNAGRAFSYQNELIASGLSISYSVTSADLNGDNMPDIVSAGAGDNTFVFLNDETGSFDAGSQISTLGSASLMTGDLNADGALDIISGESGGTVWYENNGQGSFDTKHEIESALDVDFYGEGRIVDVADMDSDGDLDIVSSVVIRLFSNGDDLSYDKVEWYENSGNGNFEPAIEIGKVPDIRNMDLGDIDGDGDIDIVSAPSQSANLMIFENDGNASFSEIIVNTTLHFGASYSLYLFDADEDEDLDIITSDRTGNSAWLENNSGFSDVDVYYLNSAGASVAAYPADLDGDGDMDIASSQSLGGGISWYENLDYGSGDFSRNEISAYYLEPFNVFPSDLDGDGDLDLIAAYEGEDVVEAYFNVFSGTDITAFSIDEQVSDTIPVIDSDAHTVDLVVHSMINTAKLFPEFTISDKASVVVEGEPVVSGTTVMDFSDETPVIYSVTAENGEVQDWTVIVHSLPETPVLSDPDSITNQGVKLSIDQIDDATHYLLYVATRGSFGDFGFLENYNGKAVGLNPIITGLESGVSYAAFIQAAHEWGESPQSNVISFTTIPDIPQLEEATEITQTSTVLRWNESLGADGYLLDISEFENFADYLPGYDGAFFSNQSTKIPILDPGSKYYAQVRSTNESGSSNPSDIITFTALPETPVARDASVVTTTSFNANWDQVDGDDLSYVIEISNKEDFSVISDSFEVTAALSESITGLEDGESHWYRVNARNITGDSPYSNVIFVEQPIVLKDLSYSEFISKENPSSTTIDFEVSGGRNEFEVTLSSRGVLQENWSETVLTAFSADTYTFEVSSNLFDEVGFVFQIYVSDGTKSILSNEFSIYWSDVQESIPFVTTQEGWQLFAIPYVLDDDLITSVFDEMADLKYKSEWRLMHYDGSKYLDAGAGISKIDIGKGYWFNTVDPMEIEFNNATVNAEDPFEISLHEGWNQVGNPYNVPISWNDVRSTNSQTSIVGRMVQYDPTEKSFGEEDVLQSFEGGFVWSDQATTLEVSSTSNRASSRATVRTEAYDDIDQDNWQVDIKLKRNDGMIIHAGSVGMNSSAASGKDEFDGLLVPRFFEYTDMFTTHDEFSYPWFSTDIVPTSEESSWLFELESNQLSGITTLEWNTQTLKAAESKLWLLDELNGIVIDMNKQSSYTFEYNGAQKFSIHYSKNPDAVPTSYYMSLGEPYPNPTSGISSIVVSLPKTRTHYQIDLCIFDMMGNKIGTVISGQFQSGTHTFQHSLREDLSAKSGIYFYRLSVNESGMEPLSKMVILK